MVVMTGLLVRRDQPAELTGRVVVPRELQLGLAASQLPLQWAAVGVTGEFGFCGGQSPLGSGALNDVHPTKNDDGGLNALGFKDLLWLGDFQQHADAAHLRAGEQSLIGVGQLIAGGLQNPA